AVLAVRPLGLLGRPLDAGPREMAQPFGLGPRRAWSQGLAYGALALVCAAAWFGGEYWQSLAADGLILLIFGISLQSMMALGGLVSFGHAAFFALGAYGAALGHVHWGLGLPLALVVGCATALATAAAFGAAVVRSGGVYLAMLSLALAQVVWATATQWVWLTGGDNGVIGLALVGQGQRGPFFLLLAVLAMASIWALGRLSRSSLGAALQAVRDAPLRAQASGLPVNGIKYRVFLRSAALAGLAGGLFAAHKGAVFPSAAGVSTSLDALLVVLLGGVHHLWGAVIGSAALTWAGAELGRGFEYWRGALGVFVMLIMAGAPSGLLGALRHLPRLRGAVAREAR
ncbi:MAG: branched-chain amino acid ABC transporter permease, partial [Burkholderiaceae bacterium]|nr:branched-chain amino acid ABC transporter permease [Burkholderiaceae bacterium]